MPDARVDVDNPWPGLAAFDESASGFFHGREDEITRLLTTVLAAPVTVLYGRSGMGKTSLLRAGLFPRLREHHLLPVYIRFDIRPGALSLMDQLRDTVLATITKEALDAPQARLDETLWEYLHRAELEIWSTQNQLLRPVIVIDQFEEIFTIGERAPALVREFRDSFGDLVENRIPGDVAGRLTDDEDLAAGLDLRALHHKVLVSLREDLLPDLDAWCTLIPALGRLRHRLVRMRFGAAVDAVHKPAAGRITREQAVRIVEIIAGRDLHGGLRTQQPHATDSEQLEVEPALLSLFCRELNEERKRRGHSSIDDELIESAKQDILSNYYVSCVQDLPERVAEFVETSLITERGFRNNFAREDAVPTHLTADELDGLIRARLLRLEDRYGTVRIELTHDVLTAVVREHRDLRRAEREKADAAAAADEERRSVALAAAQREQELEAAGQAERERRLRSEARAGRRFRTLAVVLALLLAVSVVLAITAYRQARFADQARQFATAARDDSQQDSLTANMERATAARRLAVIQQAIAVKQAVLTNNRSLISQLAQGSSLSVQLTATARTQGYRNSRGREVFRFTLAPNPLTLPTANGGVAAISYRIDSPTFMNPLMTAGPDRQFAATYDGDSCFTNVVVLVEFFDPERVPELTQFDMCAAIGPTAPR